MSSLVLANTAAAGRCCLRQWLLELAGGEGWWCRLLLLVVAACGGDGCWWWRLLVAGGWWWWWRRRRLRLLSFLSPCCTILNLSLMYVEYFLCLLITYIIPLCSFTMFLFYKLDARTPVHTFAVLVSHMTNFVLFIDTPWLYFAVLVHTYCMFPLLFLVILVPSCFWFHKPQPDILWG